MRSSSKIKFILTSIIIILLQGNAMTLTAQTTQKPSSNIQQQIADMKHRWGTPTWADTVKNPYVHNAASTDSGRMIYQHICAVCHGSGGKGDGVAASGLNVMPADHTAPLVQLQTDGSLFYEFSNGHAPMPAYKSVLTVKQRWELINYIRTLDKNKPKTTPHP